MKTEYRIIPVKNCYNDNYLQFKSIEAAGWFRRMFCACHLEEVWRFVPKEQYAVTEGICLNAEDCSTWLDEFKHLGVGYGQEQELINFVNKYPDIHDYFSELFWKNKQRKPIYL